MDGAGWPVVESGVKRRWMGRVEGKIDCRSNLEGDSMKRSDISTLTVLSAALTAHSTNQAMTWEYILWATDYPLKIIYAAIEREVNAGYLDYGVSMRTAFLTDKGKDKLKKLLDKGRS